MFYKLFSILLIGVWGVTLLPFSGVAHAKVPLTKAEISKVRKLVRLKLRKKSWRKARIRDRMTPGDSLSTGKASLADLRFNDGSLARVGERAIFRFRPKTRHFNLSNGTVLLLIPPGRGGTRIRTPNAAAAIRGSALFVRYDKVTNTTIVGALTDSGIKVSNKDASQTQKLAAGQLLVIVKNRIVSLYDFDLRTFYETSDLVRGFDLTNSSTPNPDPAIASVQAETSEALAAQKPLIAKEVKINPSFIKLSAEPRTEPVIPIGPYSYPNIDIDTQEKPSIKNDRDPQVTVKPLPTTAPSTQTPSTQTPTSSPSRPNVIINTPTVTPTTQPTVPPVQSPTPTTPPSREENPPQPSTPIAPPTGEENPPQPSTPTTPPTAEENPPQPEGWTPNPPTGEENTPQREVEAPITPEPTPEIFVQPEVEAPITPEPTPEILIQPEVEAPITPEPTPEILIQPEVEAPITPEATPEILIEPEVEAPITPTPTPEIEKAPEIKIEPIAPSSITDTPDI